MLINLRRDVLVAPHTHGTAGLVTVWGMGGRCMDLPKHYQDQALADLAALHPWPAALTRAYLQVNGLDLDGIEEDEAC